MGIGAITDEHMKSFYDQMVRAGVVKAGLDYGKAYTTQFVNKGTGKSCGRSKSRTDSTMPIAPNAGSAIVSLQRRRQDLRQRHRRA